MAKKTKSAAKKTELTPEELEAEKAEQLPEREAMSVIQGHPVPLPPVGEPLEPPVKPPLPAE